MRKAADSRRLENGSIITESVIIVPVLCFVIAGVFVLALRLSDVMYINQAARELAIAFATTPYFSEFGTSPVSYSVHIEKGQPPSDSTVTACLSIMTSDTYSGCGSPMCNTCVSDVALWHAYRVLQAKKLFVTGPLTVDVRFSAPPSDPSNANGVCMVSVNISAQHQGGVLVGLSGGIKGAATVPYVAVGAPPVNGSCSW